jgi:hypothetical protein
MATDDFARADNADIGANWTPQRAGVIGGLAMRIVSEEVLPASSADQSCEYWSAASFDADQYSEVTLGGELETGTGDLSYGVGPAVRIQTTGTGPVYGRYYVSARAGQILLIYQPDGETWQATQLGSTYTGTVTLGDTIRLEASGGTLTVKQNGTTRISEPDSNLASGAVGICGCIANNNPAVDNWEGGALAAGGPTVPVMVYHLKTQGIA